MKGAFLAVLFVYVCNSSDAGRAWPVIFLLYLASKLKWILFFNSLRTS